MLLVDMSASGLFGTQAASKREVAAEIAAMLAFSAIVNDDRVGLIVFTDEVELYVPPKKGKKHVLRVIREILSFEPSSRKTDIGVALEYLNRVTRRRSVGFLVSDFEAENWQRPIQMSRRRHDIVPVIISDPFEREIPDLGFVVFEDLETGELMEFDTTGPDAVAYIEAAARRKNERETFMRRLRMDFISVETDEPYADALIEFFKMRERRMQHQ